MKLDNENMNAIIEKLREINAILRENGEYCGLKICSDRTFRTTYRTGNYYVTVWYDANNYPYSVEINLKRHSTLAGKIFNSEIIASPCPTDEIPF